MFIFIHVPSTAGTTLWSIIPNGKRIQIKTRDDALAVESYIRDQRDARGVVGGHVDYGFASRAAPDANFFTFLRAPAERLAAVYFRKVRNGGHPASEDHDAGIIELARENRYKAIHFLTGIPISEVCERYDSDGFQQEVVEMVCESYSLIGITEQFDHSLYCLSRFLGWVCTPEYDIRNWSKNKKVVKAETLDTLRQILHVECAVYDVALKRFEEMKRPRQRLAG